MTENAKMKNSRAAGAAMLIIAALLWGGEYTVAKDVFQVMDPNWLNFIRFFLASLICLVLWRKHFAKATKSDWKAGALCGIVFGLSSSIQMIGLDSVNAGICAFLSSVYVIMTPYANWAIKKRRPGGKIFACAFIVMIGIFAMSAKGITTGHISIGIGEILCFLSAVGYTAAFLLVEHYEEQAGTEFLTGSQLIFSCLVGLAFALLFETPPAVTDLVSVNVMLEICYLFFFGSFVPQLLLTKGIGLSSANLAGIIFPLESVTATISAWIFLHEILSPLELAGAVLIIGAIVASSVSIGENDN